MNMNMNIASVKIKCKYAACVLACLVLLLAAGCEDAPDGEQSAESSIAVSQTSSVTEEGSASSESEPDYSEESMIALPSEDSSAEEASSEDVSEESSRSEPRPIYRDEEEPRLEEIVLPVIREQGFALTQDRMTVEVGERFRISYEFTPIGTTNRTLTWTSTNTKAVTVASDGTLTAVGKGITYIRATTATGRYAECKVEVVDELPYSELAKRIKAVADGEFGGLHFALCDIDQDGVQELISRRTPAEGLPRVEIYEIEIEASSEESSDASSKEISDESEEISDESSEDVSDEPSEEPMPEGWVLGFDTGDDEEWAVWERKDGTRFVLVSFSQKAENGDVKHVMMEITPVQPDKTDEEPKPVLQCVSVLMREVKNGENTYYALQDGVFAECDSDTYQAVRTAYFADNKQQNGYALTWVGGTEPKAIEKELEELTFVKK